MAELYLTIAIVFRQFEFHLFDTTEERDILTVGDCQLAMVDASSVGVRARVTEVRN